MTASAFIANTLYALSYPSGPRTTPLVSEGKVFSIGAEGNLFCLDAVTGSVVWSRDFKEDLAATGERVWETLSATKTDGKETRWANAFMVRNQDRFFLFNEKGDLIISRLTPKGYEEISRGHVIEPDNHDAGRQVVWSHPAFANRRAYVRNDHEIICVDLAIK